MPQIGPGKGDGADASYWSASGLQAFVEDFGRVIPLLIGLIFVYYFIATILPVDKIIGRIYPLFGAILIFMAVGTIVMLIAKGYNFEPTFTGSRQERKYIRESLGEFYEDRLFTDVLYRVQGGKEANVYRCAAHPATGEKWLAVKVYRPRMFRNLRNDHRYRQGRTTLMPNGRPVKARDKRLKRAMAGKTNLGKQVSHISWLMHL